MLKVFSCSDAQIFPNLILPQSDADTSLDCFCKYFCQTSVNVMLEILQPQTTQRMRVCKITQIRSAIQLLYLTCYTNILTEMMQNIDATV